MNEGNLDRFKKLLPEIFNTVSAAIGTYVMLIVLEKSLWKTKNKYPEAEKIKFSEEGIFIDELDTIEYGKAVLIINEFMLAIISTLGKLIGIQVAEKLTEKLFDDVEMKEGV